MSDQEALRAALARHPAGGGTPDRGGPAPLTLGETFAFEDVTAAFYSEPAWVAGDLFTGPPRSNDERDDGYDDGHDYART